MATDGSWGDFNIPGLDDQNNLALPSTGGFKLPEIQWGDTTGLGVGALKANAGTPSDWQAKWLGGIDSNGVKSNGIIPTGMGAFSGLAGAYLGFQQLNLAKDQLSQNKKIFNLNFQNQAADVNRNLEDRQRARVASNSSAYESVDSYMNKNKVNGKGL
jgi:hypothetical protein